jgi:GxxExxY protein
MFLYLSSTRGTKIEKTYVIDLPIEDCLPVELQSVEKLLPIHGSQLMTYMKLQKLL